MNRFDNRGALVELGNGENELARMRCEPLLPFRRDRHDDAGYVRRVVPGRKFLESDQAIVRELVGKLPLSRNRDEVPADEGREPGTCDRSFAIRVERAKD